MSKEGLDRTRCLSRETGYQDSLDITQWFTRAFGAGRGIDLDIMRSFTRGTWAQFSLDTTRIFTREGIWVPRYGDNFFRELGTKIASILCGDFKGNWPLKNNHQAFIGCDTEMVRI